MCYYKNKRPFGKYIGTGNDHEYDFFSLYSISTRKYVDNYLPHLCIIILLTN